VYDYHINNRNELTIVTAVKSFRIPYGVIEAAEDGLLTGIKEKPETAYMINTGLYILNSDLIDEIPDDEFYHITDLIDKIMKRGARVGSFPVSENALRDMGEWPEYLKMINVL
jgi:NDP-sugar pyrophosphorylase family protein